MKNILLLFCIILFIGCSSVRQDELYGEYIAEFSFGKEILILNNDLTYSQSIILNNNMNRSVHHNGTWKFSEESNEIKLINGLVVTNMYCELDSSYAIPRDGYVLSSIIKYFPWSSIRLGTGCEEIYYVKSD